VRIQPASQPARPPIMMTEKEKLNLLFFFNFEKKEKVLEIFTFFSNLDSGRFRI
jgi:hypothetical protein